MESYLDISYIAGSKQHIGNPSFEATRCRDASLIVTGNTDFFSSFLERVGGRSYEEVQSRLLSSTHKKSEDLCSIHTLVK